MVRLLTISAGLLLLAGCDSQRVESTDALSATSTDEEIMLHMLETANGQGQTDQIATHFPDLDRERAYRIQRLRLAHGKRQAEHVGWKLAWTRMAEPDAGMDPVVGHYLSDRVFEEGRPVSTRYFTNGTSNAEPEIVFYLGKDLPGPVVTREELIDAVASVGVGMEFVNWRLSEPGSREHAIVDNGIAVGVILGKDRRPLDGVDFSEMIGRVDVEGEGSSEGPATVLMGEGPIEAMLWAANELPKWGMQLSAGQFVFSGTVCPPMPVSAGDRATVTFTGLGSVSAEFVE